MSQCELIGVGKAFVRGPLVVNALQDVSLSIDEGEFVALEGPSGSGKTTLLQLLGALDRPSSGRVLFEGRDLAQLPDGELAELRLRSFGFVFQQFNLIPTLTALQNVEIAGGGAELLARVGLEHRARHLPSQLSGGEQQRVAIARALANEPEVVLADEPTGNLDTTTGEEIMEVLGGLWVDGLSLVLITHDPAVAGTAPRVVKLRDGVIINS